MSAVAAHLASLPYHPSLKCQSGAYYLLNNYNPGYFGDGTVNTTTFTIPPSSVPTIGDTLNAAGCGDETDGFLLSGLAGMFGTQTCLQTAFWPF